MRQQMEAHRRNPACASCHRRIDPPGFGLENFDGIGMWRSADNGASIDPGGTFVTKSGPQAFRDFPDLRRLLTGDDRVPLCVTQKLMTYALGRSLTEADEAAAKDVVARTESGGHRIHDVIAEIAVSPPFRGTPR